MRDDCYVDGASGREFAARMIEGLTSWSRVPEKVKERWVETGGGRANYVEGVRCVALETVEEVERVAGYLAQRVASGAWVGVDTETTSTWPPVARLVGLSLSADDKLGVYIPLGHSFGQNLKIKEVLPVLSGVLQGPDVVMANGRFDVRVLRKYGVEARLSWDSQSMSRLLGEVEYGIGLKDTVWRMFSEHMLTYEDVAGKGSFADVEIGLAASYAVPDAIYTRRVARKAFQYLKSCRTILDIEVDAMRQAADMEDVGVPLDERFVRENIEAGEAISEILRVETVEGLRKVAERRKRPASEIPDDLNLASHKQMKKALFEVCGFTPIRFSEKTGAPSTDQHTIDTLAKEEPEVDWLRRWRSAQSRVGDLKELLKYTRERDGWLWIHANMNPTGTVTGRWSSSRPNMQNKAKGAHRYESLSSAWEVKVRDAICAPPGYVLVSADYSQIELRVAAGESRCVAWLKAFASGGDPHAASAAAVVGLPIEAITSDKRSIGKAFNFAVLYGEEAASTAERLGVSLAEGLRMQEAFWEGLPEVRSWMERVKAQAKKNLYVETLFGRRRWLRDLEGGDRWRYAKALREAVNTVVQGTAADIMKLGMARARPTWECFGAKLFLVVHDQYVWLVPEEVQISTFVDEVSEAINLDIDGYPEIISDFEYGERFGSMESWGDEKEAEQVLVVEVPKVTRNGLVEFREWFSGRKNPSGVPVLLRVNGSEARLGTADIGVKDLMELRSVIGERARLIYES